MKRYALALFLFGCLPGLAPAQDYSWRMPPGEGKQAGLFRLGVQVGSYSFESGEYRTLLPGDQWSAPCEPPCKPPALMPPDGYGAETPGPKGVVSSMLSGRERLEVGGEEVDANAFFGDRPGAGGQPYILVAGDDAFLAQAKALFADGARYSALKSQWTVGFFPADGWQCQGVGYKQAGVYFLGPADAKGKAKCYSFQAAPDLEGIDIAAANTLKRCGLREPDPAFVPAEVPDLRQDSPLSPLSPAGALTWGAALALAGPTLLYLYRRRKEAAAP